MEELITEGRVKGQIAGGRSEKSVFLPAIHTQTQNRWIDSFYMQNNYVGELKIIDLAFKFLYQKE